MSDKPRWQGGEALEGLVRAFLHMLVQLATQSARPTPTRKLARLYPTYSCPLAASEAAAHIQ